MKILIKDTDEAQRAMEKAFIPTRSAISLRGRTLEAKEITTCGFANTEFFFIPPAAFTILTKD